MNSYNIYDEKNPDTILYHAIAKDIFQVTSVARDNNIDIEGLTVQLEKENVKDELGRQYSPQIKDAKIY